VGIYKCVLAGVSFLDGLSMNPPVALPVLSLPLFFFFLAETGTETGGEEVEVSSVLIMVAELPSMESLSGL